MSEKVDRLECVVKNIVNEYNELFKRLSENMVSHSGVALALAEFTKNEIDRLDSKIQSMERDIKYIGKVVTGLELKSINSKTDFNNRTKKRIENNKKIEDRVNELVLMLHDINLSQECKKDVIASVEDTIKYLDSVKDLFDGSTKDIYYNSIEKLLGALKEAKKE